MNRWSPKYVWPGIYAGAIMAVATLVYFTAGNPKPSAPHFSTPAAAQAWETAQPHFKTADDDTAAAVDKSVNRVRDYFDHLTTDGRLTAFAGDVLSWSAKFKLVTGGRDEFGSYVTERFQTLVFDDRELQAMITAVLAAYGQDVDAADNKLLLAIQSDVDAQASDFGSSLPTAAQIHQRVAELIQAAQVASADDLPKALAREAIAFVTCELATQVTAQALTSAGILGTGAASGAVSFGVGILASIAVDRVVQEVMASQEKLVRQLERKLTDLREATMSSMRAYLEELSRQRSAARQQVVVQSLGGSI